MSCRVRVLARAVRPAEWVLLAFVVLLLGEAWRAGRFDFEGEFPRRDALAALLTVVLARQLVRFRRTPWPPGAEGLARAHRLSGVLMLLPAVPIVALARTFRFSGLTFAQGGLLSTVLFLVDHSWRDLTLVFLPLALVWLALGRHLKERGQMEGGVFLRESAAGVVDAVRDWLPPFLLVVAYGSLGSLLAASGPDRDAQLRALDRALFFGHDPILALQAIVSRPLSEWLSFCYSFYVPLCPLGFGLLFALRDRRPFRELAFAVTLALALGYLCFTFVPAEGPLLKERFSVSIDDYYLADIKALLVDRYRIPRDCFPSLHTAVSFVFLWAARRHLRPLFWVLLPIVLSIPLACAYLRYHYVVDLLAGTALFALVAWVTPRILDRWERGR